MARKPRSTSSTNQNTAPVEPAAAPAPQPTPAPATASPAPTGKKPGALLNTANFLLSRLPWFQTRYQAWGSGKRIIIAFLLYLIILPVIPIVIAAIMYARDPEGFKKSKAFPILMAIIVAQLGIFGVVATQPATPDNAAVMTSPDAASNAVDSNDSKAQATNAPDGSTPAPGKATGGAYFKNCTAAFKAGVHNIPKSDKSYRKELDADNDGIACEK